MSEEAISVTASVAGDATQEHAPAAHSDFQAESAPVVLRIEHLSMTFPGTKALNDVAVEIAEGEIHALVGQNGSGKSTLIKVLAGYHQADPGSQVWLNDEELGVADAAEARHHRLRFVHQDLGLFLELNAVDNLALRGEFLLGPVRNVKWSEQADITRKLLEPFDLDLDIGRPLSEATPVQRTIVAIAAALAGWEGGPGVLVLDEPTAVLPPADVERLLDIVRAGPQPWHQHPVRVAPPRRGLPGRRPRHRVAWGRGGREPADERPGHPDRWPS